MREERESRRGEGTQLSWDLYLPLPHSPPPGLTPDDLLEFMPLDEAIVRAVEKGKSTEVKRRLYGTILLLGGGSRTRGLSTYLEWRVACCWRLAPDSTEGEAGGGRRVHRIRGERQGRWEGRRVEDERGWRRGEKRGWRRKGDGGGEGMEGRGEGMGWWGGREGGKGKGAQPRGRETEGGERRAAGPAHLKLISLRGLLRLLCCRHRAS